MTRRYPKTIKLHALAWALPLEEAPKLLQVLEYARMALNETFREHMTLNVQGYFEMDRVNNLSYSQEVVPEKLTFWQKYFKRVIPKMEIHVKVLIAQMEYE